MPIKSRDTMGTPVGLRGNRVENARRWHGLRRLPSRLRMPSSGCPALGLKVVFLTTTPLGITSLWMAILSDTGATVLVTAKRAAIAALSSADAPLLWSRQHD
jgi:hypothetical protein